MKLEELKAEVQKYQYFEDTSIIDVSLATVIANRMKLGNPVWLMIIGASSGGKSQILRPLALTDTKFIHRIDDLTENTFLSGVKTKAGDDSVSLLLRIGNQGIIVISDLTVLMSKSGESRGTILSQFRMLYDGEMVKHSGNSSVPIRWPESGKGYLGVIAGSTPSIYSSFEEVADMGERFIYFRMKEIDNIKATRLALERSIDGHSLDDTLASLYGDYIKSVVTSCNKDDIILPEAVKERIIEVSMFAERVRTTAHKDWSGNTIDRIPVPALPMRVALQLTAIARGLGAIRLKETGKCEFSEKDLAMIDWIGYSLANEEKRACLRVLASVNSDKKLTTATIADKIGLDTTVIRSILQNMSAVGVLSRTGEDGNLQWSFKDIKDYEIVRRIESIKDVAEIENRAGTLEDTIDTETEAEKAFGTL